MFENKFSTLCFSDERLIILPNMFVAIRIITFLGWMCLRNRLTATTQVVKCASAVVYE